MKMFVTGGTGFVGRHLLPYLRRQGMAVRALTRSASAASLVKDLGAESVRGDLENMAALESGMSGCDVVIHAAASTAEWGPYSEFYATNLEGTRNVLAAARAAGVRRFVHISTEAVLLDGSPLVQVDESRPLPERPIGAYPATKALAERAALAANREDFEVIVVRPRFIWGKGDTTLLPKLVEMVEKGRFAWIGGGEALTSTCHVENVCEGIALAAQHGKGGRIYFLTDGPPVKVREFLTALLRTQGVVPKDRSVPFSVALWTATVVEPIWRVLRLKSPPPLQRTSVLLIGQEVTVRDERARSELGYVAHKKREEGLREMGS